MWDVFMSVITETECGSYQTESKNNFGHCTHFTFSSVVLLCWKLDCYDTMEKTQKNKYLKNLKIWNMGPQDLTSFDAYLPGFYNYFGLSDCLYLTCLKYEFWWQLRPKVQRYNRARGAVFKARGPVTTSFELGRAAGGNKFYCSLLSHCRAESCL